MYVEHGFSSFTKGFLMRVMHSGYHTAWIAGLGAILFN
jgi:hypothetical protein